LLILSADSDYEVIRSQGLPLYSVRDGKVLMKRQMPVVEFFGDQS
jgi:cytosine deaminase